MFKLSTCMMHSYKLVTMFTQLCEFLNTNKKNIDYKYLREIY